MLTCPLCSAAESSHYHSDKRRAYFLCPVCSLVFVPADHHLTPAAERMRYERHQNDLMDPGYRDFLGQLCQPVLQRLAPDSRGLDFGSGPGPLLSQMFEEEGYRMSIYDAYFARDVSVFDSLYDFITASEVIEHLRQPLPELDRLWRSLKPKGLLGIMTGLRHPDIDFPGWYYIQDASHILFFAPETMLWLARRWSAELEFVGKRVVLLQKAFAVSATPGEDYL